VKSSDVSHTAQTQIKTLEDKLAIYTGINNELRADTANLQQLEGCDFTFTAPRGWPLGWAICKKRIGIVKLL
jgi:hypothetical protein